MNEETAPDASLSSAAEPRAGDVARSNYAEAILRAVPVPFLVLRADLRVNTASKSYYKTFQVTPEATEGRFVHEVGNGQWDVPELREQLENIIPRAGSFSGLEVTREFPGIGVRTMTLNGCFVENAGGPPTYILLSIEDITARHETEAALRDAKQRLEQTLAATEVATWTWDVRSDRIYADRNLARLFSVPPEDADGGPIAHYLRAIHLEDRARVESVIAEALQSGKGQYQMDYRLVQEDGSVRWVTARGRLVLDAAGRAARFPGVVIDITERKEAEELLARSAETFSNLIENAPFGVYVVDSDFRMRQVSAGSRKAFENVHPLIGRDFAEVMRVLWPESFAVEAIMRFRHTLETGEPYAAPPLTERRADVGGVESYDWKIERVALPDGQWGVVCYYYDVTERRRAEDELRASEERYRMLFNSIDQGFCVIEMIFDREDRPVDYRFLTLNAAFVEHTGLTGAQGKTMRELAPEQEEHWFEIYGRIAVGGEPARFEQSAAALGRWFDVYAFRVDAARRQVGVLFSDITQRRASEQALRAALVEVERSSRAKDDFLAALSHELRTPLTPVLMTATALEHDPSLPVEIRDQLEMMRRNIELEARLIDDLLDITRISRGKLTIAPAPTDIHQLIQHTAEIVRSDGLGRQVRIVFILEAERHHALAEPTRLQQVFWNLIKNALKFTPAGGTITVSTRNDEAGRIVVGVEDTGIGIAAESLPHIFKAFEQGDIAGQHRYGGLGLGLAISQAIVEVHGGSLSATSEGPGHGATFTVALTAIDAPPVFMNPPAPKAGPGRTLRLLIVEDHETTRTVLTRLLTRSGHAVTNAGSIDEALLAFSADRFDAVISDLGLPDGSGLDLMRELQRQRPVPGIALSGYGMEDDVRQTKEAGFFAHLVKPVNVEQLRQLLAQLSIPR